MGTNGLCRMGLPYSHRMVKQSQLVGMVMNVRHTAAKAASSRRSDSGSHRNSLDFTLFLLLNATLFLRPSDVIPALDGLPIYNAIILCCLVISFSKLIPLLSFRSLVNRPISICVVGLLPAALLSHLAQGYIGGALSSFNEFSKVIVYFLLAESTIDSEQQLNRFLIFLCLFIAIESLLAVAVYQGVIDLPAFTPHQEWATDPVSGDLYLNSRLQAVGIFGNPNDFSRILLVGMAICLYQITQPQAGLVRWVWVAPIVLFGNALALTQSRGAMPALLAGLMAFYGTKYGRKAFIPIVFAVPVILALFSGRQTEMSTETGTAQDRIRLWSEGFHLFLRAPLFGIGMNQFAEEVGLAAHNSFLHCFAELGLFGGTLFFGANYHALMGLGKRARGTVANHAGDDLARLRPVLLGILVLYQVGILTSNRSYSLPTYMILGLAAVFVRLNKLKTTSSTDQLGADMFLKMTIASLGFFICLYVFVRLNVHFGQS